jgi:hypothetical protein
LNKHSETTQVVKCQLLYSKSARRPEVTHLLGLATQKWSAVNKEDAQRQQFGDGVLRWTTNRGGVAEGG